jgi:hypothetical protein
VTFDPINEGQSTSMTIRLQNQGFGGDLGDLTDLTVNVDDSTLANDAFDVTIAGDGTIENNGSDFLDITLTFSPETFGNYSGQLLFNTDQGAAFGQDGADFAINIFASALAIPEPATLALWSGLGLALVGYGLRRRRRA